MARLNLHGIMDPLVLAALRQIELGGESLALHGITDVQVLRAFRELEQARRHNRKARLALADISDEHIRRALYSAEQLVNGV